MQKTYRRELYPHKEKEQIAVTRFEVWGLLRERKSVKGDISIILTLKILWDIPDSNFTHKTRRLKQGN
jgi:hypothetical protein